MTLSFDDSKPVPERRVMQIIYLLPSLKDSIDRMRPKRVSRSEWIEKAVQERLAREKSNA